MRRLPAALLLAALTIVGASIPMATAVTATTPISTAKVVIIVGATEGTTSTYRSYADAAYAEAIKYTANVTKIYSPNATWTRVKAATTGANLVLYYGHGNGWPSPYPNDPTYSTKDGFGLNDPTNLTDYVHKYYGEPSMATLGLAPNAVVLLGNLCYASGNSEPGNPEPTVSVAHQRIDNYGAGFIKGGAKAVIADGHGGLISYIRGLFTTAQSLPDLWRSAPDFHNHEVSFASTRSPGFTAYSDPDTTSGGYYRSLVTAGTLTTTQVTKPVGDTGANPTSLVVPGRAEVDAPETPLSATPVSAGQGLADATPADLPAGTRLKTVAVAVAATSTTPAVIQVAGLDDPTIAGYITADRLTPRDSRAPVLLGIDTGTARFSPNGDGRFDTQSISGTFSETVAWTLEIRNSGGTLVKSASGSGATASFSWDGLSGGQPLPDGTYTWTLRGTDAWLNGTAVGSGQVVIDTVGPSITALSPDGSVIGQFSPNGDGTVDTIATTATASEGGSLLVRVANASNTTVRTFTTSAVVGTNTVTWDGRNDAGTVVPDGLYAITIAGRDIAGNTGPGRSRTVRVVTLLGFVAASPALFYPQDLDRFAPSSTLSFKLSRPAHVTWTLRNAAGAIVLTHLDADVAAGTQSWVFNGTLPDGTMLPVGAYTSYVYADDGTYVYIQAATVTMNAFAVVPSTTSPTRGRSMSVTATTAEPLSGVAQLYVTQPGLATYILRMTAISSSVYRISFTPKTTGTTGTMTFKVWGKDADGHTQATILRLTLR